MQPFPLALASLALALALGLAGASTPVCAPAADAAGAGQAKPGKAKPEKAKETQETYALAKNLPADFKLRLKPLEPKQHS